MSFLNQPMLPHADLSILGLQADDAACGHYRVVYPLEFLRRGGAQTQVVQQFNFQMIQDHQFILAQRQHHPNILQILKEAKRIGKYVIYELDDNVHAVHPGSVAYKTYRPGSETVRNVAAAMHLADALFVTTPELANQYRGFCQRIFVLPNFIDYGVRDWEAPVEYHPRLQAKLEQVKERTGQQPVVIGWAGSITHQDDWEPLAGWLPRVLRKYPQAIFALVSAHRIMDIFLEKLQLPADQVVCLDPVGLEAYPNLPAQFDIGLIPVVNTTFNRAKSDLKIKEYGARGVPYVASKIAPYLRFHQETKGEFGYLAQTPGEWEQAVSELIEHPERRLTQGDQLSRYIRENHSYQSNAWLWADALRQVRDGVTMNPHLSRQVVLNERPKRNDRCPCGSGKKYKVCCTPAWGTA